MKYNEVLFDLDGTIIYSHPGICAGVKYALSKKGIIEEDTEGLKRFVGPPLYESFMNFYGFSKEEAEECVELYREYYKEKGIYEYSVIPGTDDLIKKLYEQDVRIFLATSKPVVFAKEILKKSGLLEYFHDVIGSGLDGSLVNKDEIIEYIGNKYNLTNPVMVGDTIFDVQGAQKNNMNFVFIAYGYGTKLSIINENVPFVANSIDELSAFVL